MMKPRKPAAMSILLVLAVHFVANVLADDDKSAQLLPVRICEELSTFRESCNLCVCSKDGTYKFCTQRKCSAWGIFWSKILNPFGNDGTGCKADKDYKVGCHICTCDKGGENIICPDEPCPVSGTVLRNFLKKKT